MKNSEKKISYSIDINKKKYIFYCSDGQEHVNKLRNIVSKTIESLSLDDFRLSDHSMKIALLLADENIREKESCEQQLKRMEDKVKLLIHKLDEVLIS